MIAHAQRYQPGTRLLQSVSVRAVNRAIEDQAQHGGEEVRAVGCDGSYFRIIRVRVKRGAIEGKALATGKWVAIRQVYGF